MAKRKFIFDETYIKRYAKKDKIKWLVLGASALVLILIIVIIVLANHKNPKRPNDPATTSYELKSELIIEAGSEIPEAADYFKKLENIDVNNIKVIYPDDFEISYDTSFCSDEENEKISNATEEEMEQFDCITKTVKTLTTYGVTIVVLDKEYTINLIIQDTKAPDVVTKTLEIYEGSTYAVEDFVELCVDSSLECKLSYVLDDLDDENNVIDYSSYKEPGTYRIRLFATDLYDNKTDNIETELKILESEASLYKVTFNSNGGTAVSDIVAPEGTNIIEPDAPTKDGYNFVGWYLGNNKYDFSTPITKSITLTAKWQKVRTTPGPVTPGVINVSSIQLDFKKINLSVGESKTVKAYVYPSNATNKAVTWSSSDNSIATVNNGKVTGVKDGTVTITAVADGKSTSLTVNVRSGVSSSCSYGDANYNSQYTLSVNLIQNNCASNPNGSYNQITTVVAREISKLNQDLSAMGLSTHEDYFSHKESYFNVKNTSGTGIVGVQITVSITVIDPANPYIHMNAEYIIKPDGSRQLIKNNIKKNNVSFR